MDAEHLGSTESTDPQLDAQSAFSFITPPLSRPSSPTSPASIRSDASYSSETSVSSTHEDSQPKARQRIVVVGLGMVGMGFIEKMIARDEIQKEYQLIVLGEEKHVAYNRVGLTSFFGALQPPSISG